MKKIFGFFLLSFLIFVFIKLINLNNQISETKLKILNCNHLNFTQSSFLNSKNFKSFKAELVIDEWRKWQILKIKDAINYKKFNQFTNRERSKGKLYISGKNIPDCFFNINLRAHGDQIDHREGDYLPSMQIKIENGNIFGITDFLLLRPKQRGGYNEIFVTALFREIGLLAPRSSMVDITFNSGSYKFIFQEKIRKEFLENSGLREGPIFEGDERFVFDQGDVPFVNHRTSNKNFSKKNLMNEAITERALSLLNFYGSNHSTKIFRNSLIDYFDLSSQIGREDFINLDIFDSLMFATDSLAGLSVQDRRFYFNSLNNKFYPIFYDGIPKIFSKRNEIIKKNINYENLIEIEKTYIKFIQPSMFDGKVSLSAVKGSRKAISLMKTVDLEKFNKHISDIGLNISDKKISQIFNIIIERLTLLSTFEENKVYNFSDRNLSLFSQTHFNSRYKNDRLVFYSDIESSYYICEINYKNCQLVEKSKFSKSKLLAQEEKNDSNRFIFIGKKYNKKIDSGWYFEKNFSKFETINFKGISFNYSNGIFLDYNQKDKIIIIRKKLPEARIIIKNQIVNNLNIHFFDETSIDNSVFIDENGLTGCLTFYDSEIINSKIKIFNAKCEDAVNFINTEGSIEDIEIYAAGSDALDLDFSNLNIKNIFVNEAGNDCADFSFGNYFVENLNVIQCGDKGLSVGEISTVNIQKAVSENSIIGIASKDGSITKIKNANLNKVDTCVSAYTKKPEFNGGNLIVENYQCNFFKNEFYLDKQSLIKLNNKSIEDL